MEYLHNPFDEEELSLIRQGDHDDVPPHHMYEAVHCTASITGYEFQVRQMGTRRVVAQRNSAEEAKQEAIRRAKNHRKGGVAFTRIGDA